MMFESAKFMYNANSTFELDFLKKLTIYLNCEVILNHESNSKTMTIARKNLFSTTI